jgi:hypothetical protein
MKWYKEFDDLNNPIFSASSVYHDSGCHFGYQVTPLLEGGKIVWTINKSDAELRSDEDGDLRWKTADAAKKWVGRREAAIIKSEKELIKNLENPFSSTPIIFDND